MESESFDPLTADLGPWFETDFAEIPDELGRRISQNYFPLLWEDLQPNQRRDIAAQWDFQHDPSTERERTAYWDMWLALDEVEVKGKKIRDLEVILNRNGNLESISPKPSNIGSEAPENSFVQKGGYWSIRFAGKETHVKSSAGLHYIRFLLQHPNKIYSVLDLYRTLNPAPAVDGEMSDQELEEDGDDIEEGLDSGGFGDLGEAMDPKGLRQIRQRHEDLRKELEDERIQGNRSRVEDLEDKVARIGEYLSSVTGKRGQARRLGGGFEKMRISIAVNIGRARASLGEHLSDLELHLKGCIRGGTEFTYCPDRDLQWNFRNI